METRLSHAQRAYKLIKEEIMTQKIGPGCFIVESDYAQKFDMSRTPVREALKRLSNEGLIDILPHKGAIIKSFTITDLIMCHEAAEALDGALAYRLAEEYSRGEIADEDMDRLFEFVDAMDVCLTQGDMQNWASYDNDFHNMLIDICGNPYIVQYTRQNRLQLNRVLWFYTPLYIDKHQSNMEHRKMLESIRAGNPSGAEAAAKAQSRRIKKELLELVRR